jgi:DNA (cytosine-5)-methyltransferase 1
MNVVDLFCGCGGFSLGARQAGIETSLAVDVDSTLSFPYLANFPRSRLLLTDISKLEAADIKRAVGKNVDGMFGGPPCQGFSNIGLRQKNDPRRDLLLDFFKLVAGLRPTFFVMENVPGLIQGNGKKLLDRGLSEVRKNYAIFESGTLEAAEFGAATRRPRVFVIGMEKSRADPITSKDLDRQRREPTTVREAISDLIDVRPLGQQDGYDRWKISTRGRPSDYARVLRANSGEFTSPLNTEHTKEVQKRFAKVKPGEVDQVGRHYKLDWEGQCPTLRAGTGSDKGSFQSVRPLHPDEPRVITVREAARLQGFPDNFRFHPTIWHSFRMIGNSVSPIISRAIFSAISKKMETSKRMLIAAE